MFVGGAVGGDEKSAVVGAGLDLVVGAELGARGADDGLARAFEAHLSVERTIGPAGPGPEPSLAQVVTTLPSQSAAFGVQTSLWQVPTPGSQYSLERRVSAAVEALPSAPQRRTLPALQ